MALSPAGKAARRYCEQYPAISTKQLSEKMHKEHPLLFATIAGARSRVRYFRNLDKHHANPDPIPFEFPDPVPDKWAPVEFTARGNGLIIADIHQPYHDMVALRTAINHAISEKHTDYCLILGDGMDCHTVSNFEKDPEARNFASELNGMRTFLRSLTRTFGQVWYKLGNHEDRYRRYMWERSAALWNLNEFHLPKMLTEWEEIGGKFATPEQAGTRTRVKIPVTMVGDNVPIFIGKHLTALHGHEYQKGLTQPVNPARGMFLRSNACTVSAHGHRTSNHTDSDIRNNVLSSWSIGCLCQMHPRYASLNKWNHGLGMLRFDGEQFEMESRRIINGKVY
jgi:hypothetical protein